jgi:hypothetical protein
LTTGLKEFLFEKFNAPIGLIDFAQRQVTRRIRSAGFVALSSRRIVKSLRTVHIATLGEYAALGEVTFLAVLPLE